MPLFDIPSRSGRKQATNIAKKSKSKAKSASISIKGGNTVLGRINEIKAMVHKNLGQYEDKYMLITEKEVLHDYITECIGNGHIAIDTETDGLDPLQNKLAGICPYTYGQKSAYIPINHISYVTGMRLKDQLDIEFVRAEFKRLLEKKPDIDMFNAPFDIRVLRHAGLPEIYCSWDAYLAARLLNDNEPTNKLKPLHDKYCQGGKGDAFTFDELFKGIPFTLIPPSIGYLYAAGDPIKTTELADFQRKHLRLDHEREDIRNMAWVFHNIEMPCVSVVCDMEDTGVNFDFDYQQELSVKYNKMLEEKKKAVYITIDKYKDDIAKYCRKHKDHKLDNPINIGSPTQLAVLLYDIMGMKSSDKRKPRGTGEEILEKMNNPVCKAILEYRTLSKLVSTYIDKLPDCVNPNDGRIHCKFNQYGADTGRFSSSDPNLQNIPSHNKDIRKMFIASPGYVMMSSDYSQQEPKVMTQMCQDPKMIKAYQEGKDLYAEIAALSFNTTYENCLEFRADGTTNPDGKNRRSQAKSILLGVLDGRGVPSIAEQLNTTTKKAQAIKDSVFKGFPAIPNFEKASLEMAEELGYVTTLWGRKRRLPDLQLDEYEFKYKDGAAHDEDLLDFSDMNPPEEDNEVPEDVQDYYYDKLENCWGKKRAAVFKEALEEGIIITDNTTKIAQAERQCVNARIQGSAADMSKLAMILVGNDKKLKEWGFRLLIPVHDELIGECPKENAAKCKKRFAQLMSDAAKGKLTIPISCDVETTEKWYGQPFSDDELKKWAEHAEEVDHKHGVKTHKKRKK